MNETYIVINGKRAELTEEQLKQLGIATEKKSPFSKAEGKEFSYSIMADGTLSKTREDNCHPATTAKLINVANYCTNKAIMEQRALHETLNRLLWRYSMEHDGDKLDWDDLDQHKWFIYWLCDQKRFLIDYNTSCYNYGRIYFYKKSVALKAIEEVIKPFMKEHPEFVW